MRPPYVLILLAVATRPVDVGAHADPSDIVTTDSRVQRHLRVQERTPDQDNDERTFPSVEEIVSPNAIDRAADMLDLTIEDYDLSDASYNVVSNLSDRKRSADKMLQSMSKKIKGFTVPNEIMADMRSARSQNMQMNKGEKPKKSFEEIMSKCSDTRYYHTLKRINTLALRYNETPQQVFELYQLNYAENTLFQKPQLPFWVKYLEAYNNKMSTRVSLFDTIRDYYDVKSLVVALANASEKRVTFAEQVENQLTDFWLKTQVTPVDAFTRLELHKVISDDALLVFWVKYFVYYNDHVGINDKVLVESATLLLKQPYLLKLFDLYTRSESTKDLEKQLKDMQLKIWENEKASIEKMHQTLDEVRWKTSVYAYAVRGALQERLFPRRHSRQ